MILRDYCVDWIIGWVVYWIAFMSVFFHSRKTGFFFKKKKGSTPPRPLAISWDSLAISYCFPNSSSIPGGSIEKAPASLIASRHLLDRSSFCSWIWWVVSRYQLDTSAVDDHFLDTYLDSFLDTSRHLHLSSFIEGLYIHSSRSDSHFFDLSRSVRTYSSPKHSLSHSKPLPLWFFKLFQDFLLLVSF